MSIAAGIRESMERSSFIRKMFEEGLRLKKQFGEENVFDFSLGNPDLNPPVEFFDTVKALVEKPEKGVHGYMRAFPTCARRSRRRRRGNTALPLMEASSS